MINLNKKLKGISILALCGIMLCGAGSPVYAATAPSITYSTHVENVGWQEYVPMGEMSGTSGRGFRLEGIQIKLNKGEYDLGIEYQTHIQNIGWEAEIGDTWNGNPVPGWKTSDVVAGTYGRAWRLEGIKIRLTGADADKFDVLYKTHIQNVGWETDWKKNGEMSGTSGRSLRLEGIHIQIVPNDKFIENPGDTPTIPDVPDVPVGPPDNPEIIDIDNPNYVAWPINLPETEHEHMWVSHMAVDDVNGEALYQTAFVNLYDVNHKYPEQWYQKDVKENNCKYNYIEWLQGYGNTIYPNGIESILPNGMSYSMFATSCPTTNLDMNWVPANSQEAINWCVDHERVDFMFCAYCGKTTNTIYNP